MTSQDIIDLTKDTSLLNSETLKRLESLLEEYPYFQTARLLYVLNLKKLKDSDYSSELRKLSFYAGDRQKIFYLIEADKFLPLNINELKKKEKDTSYIDSFALIDSFLSDKEETQNIFPKNNIKKESLVSNDYLSLLLSEDTINKETDAEPMAHQDIIDEFLEGDKKSPIKINLDKQESDLENKPELIQENTVENTFFSETLAKIYLKQKKYEKALEIIKKLNLLYPEKNIYFADQIRFLEKLIININKYKEK